MTTYVSRQIQIQVAEKSNGEDLVFRRGDRPTKFDAVVALNEAKFSKFSIPIPQTDYDLIADENISAARILYLETNTEMTVKLGSVGDTGIVVKPIVVADADTKKGVLYLEGDFTHVYVTFVGSSGSADVLMGVVGA
jgi:hypothetical protein